MLARRYAGPKFAPGSRCRGGCRAYTGTPGRCSGDGSQGNGALSMQDDIKDDVEYFDEKRKDKETLQSPLDENCRQGLVVDNCLDVERKQNMKDDADRHMALVPPTDLPPKSMPTPECKGTHFCSTGLGDGHLPSTMELDCIRGPYADLLDLVDTECIDSLEATLAMGIDLNFEALMPREILYVARARVSSARFYG